DFKTRGEIVYSSLSEIAERTQRPIRKLLEQLGYEYYPFWITNMIIVKNADGKLLELLQKRSDIESIQKVPPVIFNLETPKPIHEKFVNGTPVWSVELVKAPQAWKKGATGKG